MMFLLTVTICGGNLIKKYKVNIINESILATLLGLAAGFLLKISGGNTLIKNIAGGYVKFFLILLLPPIIFEG